MYISLIIYIYSDANSLLLQNILYIYIYLEQTSANVKAEAVLIHYFEYNDFKRNNNFG